MTLCPSRPEVGLEFFRTEFGRAPLNPRELAGNIARPSRQKTTDSAPFTTPASARVSPCVRGSCAPDALPRRSDPFPRGRAEEHPLDACQGEHRRNDDECHRVGRAGPRTAEGCCRPEYHRGNGDAEPGSDLL